MQKMFYSQKKAKNDPSMKRLRQNTRIEIPSEDEIRRHHQNKQQLGSLKEEEVGTARGGSNAADPSTSSVSAGLQGLSIAKTRKGETESTSGNSRGGNLGGVGIRGKGIDPGSSQHKVQESKFLMAKVKDNVQYIVIAKPECLQGTSGTSATTQDHIIRHLEKQQERDANNRSRSLSGARGGTTASDLRSELIHTQTKSSQINSSTKNSLLDQVQTFAADKVIGKGSFGVVYKARNLETKDVVAIKKVYQDRRFKNRELQIMRTIKHPNIVELKNYYFSTSSNKDIYLNMLLEYVPDSLFQASHGYLDKQSEVPLSVVKLYMYQLLRALAYIHSKKICHRDIKPQNVLVNAVNGDCKLCDFGSAKQLIPGEENIAYICSRYYRAPELVFGATIYTTAIDVWSVGCVMGEMIIGHPLFAGETGVDQLVEIIKILGTPTKDQINLMNPNYKEMKFPQVKGSSLHKCFKTKTSPEAIDLLEKMLQYSPKDRITAAEAMCHPFFEDLVRRTLDLPLSMALPDVCNWLPGELDTFPKDVRNTLDSFRMRPT